MVESQQELIDHSDSTGYLRADSYREAGGGGLMVGMQFFLECREVLGRIAIKGSSSVIPQTNHLVEHYPKLHVWISYKMKTKLQLALLFGCICFFQVAVLKMWSYFFVF